MVALYFTSFALMFALFCAGWVTLGLVEELVRFVRRRLGLVHEEEEEKEIL